MEYIANLGTDNATWMSTELDAANGNRIAEDLGTGHVLISAQGLAILRQLSDVEDGSISEDADHGIQTWIEGIPYPLIPATSGAYTIAQVANELDTTTAAVTTLIDQISDDADMYNADTNTLTEGGLAILRAQLATETPTDQTLDELAEATAAFSLADDAADAASAAWDTAKRERDDARARRNAAIRAAVAYGHPKSKVAAAADLSREMLYRILG